MEKIKSKAELYDSINTLFFDLIDQECDFPFNIFKICKKLKNYSIKTENLTTPGLRGIALISKNPDLNCIIINSALSQAEQNFHGMHELIHTKLHAEQAAFTCFDNPSIEQNGFIEWQANEGAAELMSPMFRFIPDFVQLYTLMEYPPDWVRRYGKQDIYNMLAFRYGYSPAVAKIHIDSLCYEIDQYIKTRNLSGIDVLSRSDLMRYQIISTDYNKQIAERRQAIMAHINKKNKVYA